MGFAQLSAAAGGTGASSMFFFIPVDMNLTSFGLLDISIFPFIYRAWCIFYP